MSTVAQILVALAALAHVAFFVLESVVFSRPDVYRRFGLRTAEDAALVRPMAYNQGFYNLFLAVGAITGLVLHGAGRETAGTTAAVFACACMAGAGLVLFSTDRRFLPAAAVQMLAPLLAIVLIAAG